MANTVDVWNVDSLEIAAAVSPSPSIHQLIFPPSLTPVAFSSEVKVEWLVREDRRDYWEKGP